MSNKPDCTCGGCLTDTTCKHGTNTLKSDMQVSVVAYGTPNTFGEPTGPQQPSFTQVTESGSDAPTFTFDPHATLNEELLKDLLERVQKLEKKVDKLQKQNNTLQEKLKLFDFSMTSLIEHFRDLYKGVFS